jgi:predicted transcriptional regulator
MKVLLAIKPEYAYKILNGSKLYEYRRVMFKNVNVKTALVYASKPVGEILGEFEIGEIMFDVPALLWEKTKPHSGITEQNFMNYFSDKAMGYAIKIKRARTYDSPLSLGGLNLRRPPQSFAYIR